MRIVDIRETAIPLKSDLRNSGFDFSEMTTSVVAVITDVIRDGKPVAGFAFNSTGRYACGAQMRARFIPRILKAEPKIAAQRGRRQSRSGKNPRRDDAEREVRRPQRALGRHRHDRGGGVGRGRQDRGQAAASRAGRALQRRQGAGQGVLLRRRRLVRARQDHQGLAGRDAAASRFRLHHGEDEGRRHDARRGHEPHRGGEVRGRQPRHARGRRQLQVRARRGARLRQGDVALQAALVRGALRSARLRDARRRSPTPTTARCRPARTCSRPRTSRTWCGSAA